VAIPQGCIDLENFANDTQSVINKKFGLGNFGSSKSFLGGEANKKWAPFKFFSGKWLGTGKGQAGTGEYEHTYEFILNDRFLFVRNQSIYPPLEQNPTGETHQDWGFISFDKGRNTFVYRQFHIEGFVNQYVLEQHSPDFSQFSFISESIENISHGWRAKENYRLISSGEFIESFLLAESSKNFELYTECHLKKIKQ
jgi:hypothetical protein